MQRLRNTFQRSRTPTGADMKMQSSLDVPKTVRSASFDEIQLEAKRSGQAGGEAMAQGPAEDGPSAALLRVPLVGGQRSKSFDTAGPAYSSPPPSAASTSTTSTSAGGDEGGAFLEVPARSRFQRRRSSGERAAACIHCALMEEWQREPLAAASAALLAQHSPPAPPSPDYSGDDDSDDDDAGDDSDDEEDDEASLAPESPPPWAADGVRAPPSRPPPPWDGGGQPGPSRPSADGVAVAACGIRVTLSTSPASPDQERPPTPPPASPVRRRSIQRQEAFFIVEPPAEGNSLQPQGSSSLEYASDATSDGSDAGPWTEPAAALGSTAGPGPGGGLLVRDFYLAVPELKRDRAASVDSCFINKTPAGGKAEEVVQAAHGSTLEPPMPSTLRSRSVDIVLPTDEQARYKALAMAAPAASAAPTVQLAR